MTLQMRDREALPAALVRAGLTPEDADRAAAALADDFDTVNAHPGLTLLVTVSPAAPGATPRLQLTSLELTPRDDERLGLSREADGALHLRRIAPPAFTAPSLTRGVVRGSLYLSIVETGVEPAMAAKVVGLFGRRLDLTRDVESGDRFRLAFEQDRRIDGRAGGPGDLLYADVTTRAGTARLYRYRAPGAPSADWVDGEGKPHAAGLLRTPVDGARVTSTYGFRMHPLLGFTRLHQGVDFGAAEGAPVLAAGDGVVVEARWAGDLGRWLKIRHASGLETGYGHLSGWATGLSPGTAVHQGQVVAYVGATGLATGPHLHYEVFRGGQRIDPRTAPSIVGASRDSTREPDFRARKASIDATIASLSAECASPGLFPASPVARCIG